MKRLVIVLVFAALVTAGAQEHKPDLWLLAIGINRYYNVPREQHLRFAKQNLKAIIDSLKPHEGKVFNNIRLSGSAVSIVFNDGAVTIDSLVNFVTEKAGRISRDKQRPVVHVPGGMGELVIGLAAPSTR